MPFHGMTVRPDVNVAVDQKAVDVTIIANSVIYGIIRDRARSTIDKAIEGDAELSRLVAGVRDARQAGIKAEQEAHKRAKALNALAPPAAPTVPWAKPATPPKPTLERPTPEYTRAQKALRTFLVDTRNWNERDAALMVQYASLDVGERKSGPRDVWYGGAVEGISSLHNSTRLVPAAWGDRVKDEQAENLVKGNLGPLSAVGEQKATQFFAQLASRFDPGAANTYEAIFRAWGGDVRERAVELGTGEVRPRETDTKAEGATVKADSPKGHIGLDGPGAADFDSTIYARVEYLDPDAKLTDVEKTACLAVLKNLPVTFTFAPMNLLHYRVAFPAKSTRTVAVTYSQYAYTDTAHGGSYQLAYVLHPATLWNDFGPINLKVQVPKGVACKASVPLTLTSETETLAAPPSGLTPLLAHFNTVPPRPTDTYAAKLTESGQKSGELFVAVDRAALDATAPPPPRPYNPPPKPAPKPPVAPSPLRPLDNR